MPELTNENKKPEKKTSEIVKKATTANAKSVAKKTNSTAKVKTTTSSKGQAKKSTVTSPRASTAQKNTTSNKNASTTAEQKKTTTTKANTNTKKIASTRKEIVKQETVASKAIKDAKEKVVNEVKENLKQEVSKVAREKVEVKKVEAKVGANETKKEEPKKEENVIQKIKNFIAKIVAMQEETRKEAENKKALKESLREDKEKDNETDLKSKYMLEYYDLPYRYNETVVKILAQTPKRLFVYWDISDSDKKKYQEAFGDSFFEDTYPVLLVHNEEKKYTFEVPINDFANSWYLDINDPKSKYVIQLGRKFKKRPEFVNIATTSEGTTVELHNDYVPITTSNVLEVPNDHILFENIGEKALYRNVKTNEESYVDIANSEFMKKIGKIYNVYDLYKEIYKNELGEGSLTDLLNPSSMSSSGTNSSMFR